MLEKNYTAFISYRHQTPDQEIAKRLHTAIETYPIPGSIRKKTGLKKMGRVFRDQEELPLSTDLGKDIETALDRSEWFIAVCSPRYLESRWCLRELEYFISKKGRNHVLTILTEGEPEDSFPEVLRTRENEAGELIPIEPLAADVRGATLGESLKKLRNEKLRLFAPILGVTYDDLRLREKQRRKKRAAVIAASAAVICAVVAGILIRNAKLRQEAEEQRRRAEEERIAAVTNSIGKTLERTAAMQTDSDQLPSVELLLEALKLSDENGGLQREEILSRLRKAMYIEPFTVVSKLDLQNARLNNAVISPDGTKALCIANGNAAALIDLAAGKVLYSTSKGSDEIEYIAFSPDGSRFLTLSDYYRYATVWNTSDGSEVFTYLSKRNEKAMIANAAFWQGPDTLLVQDYDQFFLVSLPGGEETLFYTIGEQQEGYDPANTLYTFGTGKSLDEIILDYADDYAHSDLHLSDDGSRILISGMAGQTGTIILDSEGQRVSLLDRMPAISIDFYDLSPDGKYASCQTYIGFAAVWETETGRLRSVQSLERGFTDQVTAPFFSPDSQKIAFISESTLFIEKASNGKELVRVELEPTQMPPQLRWSDDGQYLFLYNPNLYFINAEDGSTVLFSAADMDTLYNNAVPAGDSLVFVTRGGGEAVCYSLPGIATVVPRDSYEGQIVGWDPLQAEDPGWESKPVREHHLTDTYLTVLQMSDEPTGPWYSQDGKYAALVYEDGVIEVFSREDPGHVALMNAQFADGPTAFGIAADTLCAADSKGRLLFQHMNDSQPTVLDTGLAYGTFVFSPDGKILMAAKTDGSCIDVYSVPDAEKLFSMTAQEVFQSMGFSEDGEYAIGFTENGCVTGKLWTDENEMVQQAAVLIHHEEFIMHNQMEENNEN